MSGPAWVGWVVAAVAVLVAVIAEALRRIEARRWEADTTRLQKDVIQWWDEAQKRRRTIEELETEGNTARNAAQAEAAELRAKLSRAEWRLSDDRLARRLRAKECWCKACQAGDLDDDDEAAP